MPNDPGWFVCPDCGSVSFNPHDVVARYCGNCHTFPEQRTRDYKALVAREREQKAAAERARAARGTGDA